MVEYTVKKLKRAFFSYFKSKGHEIIKSSSVIPSNDPSLLFTNSGMVQFKNILMGQETNLKRACSIQRCIRAGGKHNDLDDVGKDTYHHTFFEMMGNWSFGDYFKKEAIEYAWDFLVNILKLEQDRLYVTYYKDMDSESYNIWKEFLPSERIIEADKNDNFWEMGDTGPCGPCTEIHYDRIGGRDASRLVNQDNPDVIEIWNIVFIEYNRTPTGLEPLERKCIDTGIGFERLLSILNNVKSNYLTNCFVPIIKNIENMTDKKYEDKLTIEDTAFRAVSDHCRTIAVCLIDNVEFSNEGQGYVLRRILRRAVRYAHDILKMQRGDIGNLVKEILKEMLLEILENDDGEIDHNLYDTKIKKGILDVNREEDKFLETLQKGLERFKKMSMNSQIISSEEIFRLYDTYGFPTDLVQMLAEENNVKLDFSKFEECKEKARELSKKINNEITEIILSDVSVTDDQFKYTENGISGRLQFFTLEKKIIKFNVINDDISSSLESICNISENNPKFFNLPPENTRIGMVFDRTCFYSESGGQIGDTGLITFYEDNVEVGRFIVDDCKKVNGYVLHYGKLQGKVTLYANLEYDDRSDIERNHTGTHLFNYFLRKEINTMQRGSLVAKNKFRFDFEGHKIDLQKVEDNINLCIQQNLPVTIKFMPKEDLLKEENLIYMKNEEYPSIVRMICIGKLENPEIKELCGGCHVKNTGDLYKLKIISESSISSNVRRVIGITGNEVRKAEKKIEEIKLKVDNGEVVHLDKSLPLFERLRLEAKVKENIEAITKAKKENFTKNLKNLKMIIAVTRDTPVKYEQKILYEYQTLDYETKKDILKNIGNFIKLFKEDEDFLLWGKCEDFVHGYVKQTNSEEIRDKFKDGFFLMKNGILQFSFKTDKNVKLLFN